MPPANLVTNGDFSSDATWIWGNEWTYNGVDNDADADAGGGSNPLEQDIGTLAGIYYLVAYWIKATDGTIIPYIGANAGTGESGVGRYFDVILCSNDGDNLKFVQAGPFAQTTIDDVYAYALYDGAGPKAGGRLAR